MEIFEDLLIEGYDHIVDIDDGKGTNIIEVARNRGHVNVVEFLEALKPFEVCLKTKSSTLRNSKIFFASIGES